MEYCHVKPEANPVSGAGATGALDQPVQALEHFYQAFNGRDLTAMAENWASSEAGIAMDNPLGGIKRGWAEIEGVYRRLFTGTARVYVEFFDYTLHVSGDCFFAVGRERGHFEQQSDRVELAIRTSRIYRRLDGRWRQVHHHGSIEDPELLARYQAAVRAAI